MVSFNTETLTSGTNSLLQTLFVKFGGDIVIFKNLLKMRKSASTEDGHGKGKLNVLSYVPIYI